MQTHRFSTAALIYILLGIVGLHMFVDKAFAADSPNALDSLDLGAKDESKGDWVASVGL